MFAYTFFWSTSFETIKLIESVDVKLESGKLETTYNAGYSYW